MRGNIVTSRNKVTEYLLILFIAFKVKRRRLNVLAHYRKISQKKWKIIAGTFFDSFLNFLKEELC